MFQKYSQQERDRKHGSANTANNTKRGANTEIVEESCARRDDK